MTRMTQAQYEASLDAAYALGHSDARAAMSGTHATPRVRRLASSLGVDLANVRGTGVAGRITPADVRAAAGATVMQPASQDAYPASWKRTELGAANTVNFAAPSGSGATDAYPADWDRSPVGDNEHAPAGAANSTERVPRAGKHAGTAYPADWAL